MSEKAGCRACSQHMAAEEQRQEEKATFLVTLSMFGGSCLTPLNCRGHIRSYLTKQGAAWLGGAAHACSDGWKWKTSFELERYIGWRICPAPAEWHLGEFPSQWDNAIFNIYCVVIILNM